MSYYHTCVKCKANLDPGEHCDCCNIDDLIIGYDKATNGDVVVLTIARRIGDSIKIIERCQGDEAMELYSKLTQLK